MLQTLQVVAFDWLEYSPALHMDVDALGDTDPGGHAYPTLLHVLQTDDEVWPLPESEYVPPWHLMHTVGEVWTSPALEYVPDMHFLQSVGSV